MRRGFGFYGSIAHGENRSGGVPVAHEKPELPGIA